MPERFEVPAFEQEELACPLCDVNVTIRFPHRHRKGLFGGFS